MPIIRVSRSIGPYQVSMEGKEEEVLDLIKGVDVLASKIGETAALSITVPLQNPASQPLPEDQPQAPTISNATSAPEAITMLFQSPWGSTPRTIGEIKQTLDANALFYPTTSLSGVLIKLARQGKLRRWKTGSGYSYVRGKISE